MDHEARQRLLDQISTMPVLPDGVSVNVAAAADGRPLLTFCHPLGVSTVPVDPETGEVDAETLRQLVAEVAALPPVAPED